MLILKDLTDNLPVTAETKGVKGKFRLRTESRAVSREERIGIPEFTLGNSRRKKKEDAKEPEGSLARFAEMSRIKLPIR